MFLLESSRGLRKGAHRDLDKSLPFSKRLVVSKMKQALALAGVGKASHEEQMLRARWQSA